MPAHRPTPHPQGAPRAPRRGLRLTALGLAALTLAPSAQAYDITTPDIVTKNPTIGRQGLYLVQEGDTLWDLSEVFFGEPWFWPTLWSYNPQVTNPHWIYPGDLLQMQVPRTRGTTSTIVWSESRYSEDKVDLEIFSRYVGYLPDRAFKESGRIAYARESHRTLGEYDEVYIEFAQDVEVKRGERFTIYRNEGPITHPLDADRIVGYKIRHLGIARVLDADQHYVKALILKSYEEIYRDDLITSLFPHSWDVAPRTNEVELVGTLVDHHQPVTFSGQFDYGYIDKGRIDGVERGNRFVVERRGDGLWYDEPPDEVDLDKFPWEFTGEVMVVEAFEETSLVIVTRAIKELIRGDRLHMKKGY